MGDTGHGIGAAAGDGGTGSTQETPAWLGLAVHAPLLNMPRGSGPQPGSVLQRLDEVHQLEEGLSKTVHLANLLHKETVVTSAGLRFLADATLRMAEQWNVPEDVKEALVRLRDAAMAAGKGDIPAASGHLVEADMPDTKSSCEELSRLFDIVIKVMDWHRAGARPGKAGEGQPSGGDSAGAEPGEEGQDPSAFGEDEAAPMPDLLSISLDEYETADLWTHVKVWVLELVDGC